MCYVVQIDERRTMCSWVPPTSVMVCRWPLLFAVVMLQELQGATHC
jgi:hypothetical protein